MIVLSSFNSVAQDQPWWNSWVKYPTNQAVIVGDPGSWDAYLSTPTVIFEDGIFKMWYRGINKANTAQQIGYAWSYDGVKWEVKKEPVIPVEDKYIKGTGTVLRINDTLKMWYWVIDTDFTATVNYAWSLDDTTWHELPEPVLEAGEPGTWDEYGPWLCNVFYDSVKYHMFYITPEDPGHFDEIGHAVSDDGIHWERDSSNPIVKLGPDGSFHDDRTMAGPFVFHDDTLHMFFSGYDIHNGSQHPMIGYAWSTDAPNWSEWTVGNNHMPVLEVGKPGSWDQKYADLPGILYHDGIFHMWYDGRSVPIDGKIGYARQSVSCLPEGFIFSDQLQIDDFSSSNLYCNHILGDIQISGDGITNLDGLLGLTSISGDLIITGNNLLESLSGLINISSVGGDLIVSNNPMLETSTGLENLESIQGDLTIQDNDILTNIGGFNNNCIITGDLTISGNTSLETCHIPSICDYLEAHLEAPSGTQIDNNASGCSNLKEVREACGIVGISDAFSESKISLYPNPATRELNVACPDGVTIDLLTIYNMLGKTVLSEEYNAQIIYISIINKCLYLVELTLGDSKIRRKLLIE